MDLPLFDLPDVPPRLSTPYAKGSDTSKAAAERAKDFVGPQGARVLTYVVSRGERGATQREASTALRICRQSMAARFRALEERRQIQKTDARREGCVVYTATAGTAT